MLSLHPYILFLHKKLFSKCLKPIKLCRYTFYQPDFTILKIDETVRLNLSVVSMRAAYQRLLLITLYNFFILLGWKTCIFFRHIKG